MIHCDAFDLHRYVTVKQIAQEMNIDVEIARILLDAARGAENRRT